MRCPAFAICQMLKDAEHKKCDSSVSFAGLVIASHLFGLSLSIM